MKKVILIVVAVTMAGCASTQVSQVRPKCNPEYQLGLKEGENVGIQESKFVTDAALKLNDLTSKKNVILKGQLKNAGL